jgi:NADH-quinone oxidoreductase subunit J
MATMVFVLLAAAALGSAGMVVLEKNPVYSVLYLVLTLLSIAVIYATLGAPFLAAIQVIVYAGAIMVLFLFVVMLLDLRRGAAETRFPYQGVVAPSLVGLLLAAIGFAVTSGTAAAPGQAPATGDGNTEALGKLLFGTWTYPLEVASALLLAGIIGAIVLAKR